MADEDKILFGSSSLTISDEFCNRTEAALVEGVASLPLMSMSTAGDNSASDDGHNNNNNNQTLNDETDQGDEEENRDLKMLNKLKKAYLRNVDLLEIYLERNIFSVAKRTKHFRQRIVEAFEKGPQKSEHTESPDEKSVGTCSNPNGTADAKDEGSTSTTIAKTETRLCIPTGPQDVPTPEMMAALEEDIQSIRLKLVQARNTRSERLQYCRNLEQAAAFSEESKDVLSGVMSMEQLPGAVEKMVEARSCFQELQRKGRNLVQKMDNDKKGRTMDEKENDKIVLAQPQEKKTKLSLEEQYQEHKNVLSDLSQVKALLRHKP